MSEHCVQVSFAFTDSDLDPVLKLEDELREAIEAKGVGEFDGDEIGDGDAVLYMYGRDADALLDAITPVLRRSRLIVGGSVYRRYGAAGSGAREARTAVPR